MTEAGRVVGKGMAVAMGEREAGVEGLAKGVVWVEMVGEVGVRGMVVGTVGVRVGWVGWVAMVGVVAEWGKVAGRVEVRVTGVGVKGKVEVRVMGVVWVVLEGTVVRVGVRVGVTGRVAVRVRVMLAYERGGAGETGRAVAVYRVLGRRRRR